MTSKTWELLVEEISEEISADSDRAVVVLAGAAIDSVLGELLRARLRPLAVAHDPLLDGDTPLSTFSARIHLVHRLGLIDDNFARALHLVRSTRNEFAHQPAGRSLAESPHRERVRELTKCFAAYPKVFARTRKTFEHFEGPAGEFRTAASLLLLQLEISLSHVQPVDVSKQLSVIPHDEILDASNG